MDHDEWLEMISAEADGELDRSESARLAAHLDGCPSCAQLLTEFEATRRRSRMRTASPAERLVPAVLEVRERQHRDADRARTVLIWRSTAAALATAAAVIALVLVTSGEPTVTRLEPRRADDALIAAQDRSFDQADIEIEPGTTVEWHNAGTHAHHLVREFDGVTIDEDLLPGRTETATFDRPGTFAYYCTIHPEMSGTVTVDA